MCDRASAQLFGSTLNLKGPTFLPKIDPESIPNTETDKGESALCNESDENTEDDVVERRTEKRRRYRTGNGHDPTSESKFAGAFNFRPQPEGNDFDSEERELYSAAANQEEFDKAEEFAHARFAGSSAAASVWSEDESVRAAVRESLRDLERERRKNENKEGVNEAPGEYFLDHELSHATQEELERREKQRDEHFRETTAERFPVDDTDLFAALQASLVQHEEEELKRQNAEMVKHERLCHQEREQEENKGNEGTYDGRRHKEGREREEGNGDWRRNDKGKETEEDWQRNERGADRRRNERGKEREEDDDWRRKERGADRRRNEMPDVLHTSSEGAETARDEAVEVNSDEYANRIPHPIHKPKYTKVKVPSTQDK